jgi:hypothetical protein
MNDTLVAGPGYARLADGVYSESTRQFAGHTYLIEVNNVRTVRATGAQGADMAYLYGSAGDDVFEGRLEFSRLSSAASNKTRFDLKAEAFKQVFLRLGQGAKAKDAVALYDSTGSDTLNAMRNAIELHYPDLNGVKRFINVSGLGRKTPVTATSRKGGRDRVVYAAFPAYPLTLIGPWKKTPRPAHRNTKT